MKAADLGPSDRLSLESLSRADLMALGFKPFDDRLMLMPPGVLGQVRRGTVLRGINGKDYVVGVDAFDDDTRYGVLAYGVVPRD